MTTSTKEQYLESDRNQGIMKYARLDHLELLYEKERRSSIEDEIESYAVWQTYRLFIHSKETAGQLATPEEKDRLMLYKNIYQSFVDEVASFASLREKVMENIDQIEHIILAQDYALSSINFIEGQFHPLYFGLQKNASRFEDYIKMKSQSKIQTIFYLPNEKISEECQVQLTVSKWGVISV